MPYIGQQPTSVAFLTDTFSGNGSTTAFTLSAAPATTSSILVAVSGVLQDPSTYSSVGTTLNFSAAPPSGTGNISVRFLGIPASGVTTTAYRTVTEFTATAAQTTFSTPSYTPGFIDVYRNGVMLGSADYTATNGTTVVLASGATAGDLIEVISFQVSSVLNAIPNSPSSVNTSNLVDGSVTTAKIAAGAVIQADIATGVAGTGPAFSAFANTNQSLSSGVVTKVNFGSEVFDTNSNFDTSTSRFTPTVAGYYSITASIGLNNTASTQASIFKNGSVLNNGAYLVNSASYNGSVSSIVYMNGTTDYLEIYMYAAGSSIQISGFQREAYFMGSLVRAA